MLGDTEISAELEAIRAFYRGIQPDLDRFMCTYGLHCPSGCGACCAHFIPDITASEALIIGAAILFGEMKDILRERIQKPIFPDSTCPFYDVWSPHHCMVYSVRPLVCRTFFSAPSEGKRGELEFMPCRFSGTAGSPEGGAMAAEGFLPMGFYGTELAALPGNSDATEMLPEAVEKAVNRLGYALNLLFPDSSSSIEEGRIRIG